MEGDSKCPICGTMAYKSGFCINHYREYESMKELESKTVDLIYLFAYLVKALEFGVHELRIKDNPSNREDFHWWKREPGDGYHEEGS